MSQVETPFTTSLPAAAPAPAAGAPPFAGLLEPAVHLKIAEKAIAATCPVIREIVNFATHAFRAADEGAGRRLAIDEGWAHFRLYYRIIEMADGVEILLRQAASYQAAVPLRSAFEAALHLAFIHRQRDFREASLAWLVGNIQHDIQELDRKRPDPHAPDAPLSREIDEMIEERRSALRQSHLIALDGKIKKGAWLDYLLKTPKGNKASLWTLCEHLDQTKTPEANEPDWKRIYRDLLAEYHNVVHGSDYGRFKTAGGHYQHLRRPDQVRFVGQMTALLTLLATFLSISRFRPDQLEALRNWYVTRVDGRLPDDGVSGES
jgi:hypothetical protein